MNETPHTQHAPTPPAIGHSHLGIASFAIVLASLMIEYCSMAAAGIVEDADTAGKPASDLTRTIIIVTLLVGVFGNVVGVVVGLVDLFKRNRKKLFAALGVLIGIGHFALLACPTVVGLILSRHRPGQ